MAKGLKLKDALNRDRGVDFAKEHQKKLRKQAEKKKAKKQRSGIDVAALEDDADREDDELEVAHLSDADAQVTGELSAEIAAKLESLKGQAADGWETDESEDAEDNGDDEEEEGGVGLGTFEDESDSDSEDEGDGTFYTAAGGSPEKKRLPQTNGGAQEEDADDDDGEEQEDIALSDIESLASEDRADVIPHQRLTINNTAALQRSLRSFALPSTLHFSAVQSVTSAEPITIADVEDDITRELAFYRQSLDAVKEARIRLKKEGVPFTRPTDYFAEMVKSEEQMGKVRSKQLDEAARKKASADARRQRDLKKFGKAVQIAKTQERAKEKRDTLDKINVLKRKRQGAELSANEDSLFDVALEDAAETDRKDRSARRSKDKDGPNRKRQKKDEKFGFGGKKRFKKSNDKESTNDMRGFSARKMKGGNKAKRPGKSRRANK
ncbi:Eukaryotic rRNA processing protein EBP2 [Teratosphaeria destructans]|uniref:Eukaryotic rRNA processing protein EBP2 n=1 Tax=Teratosphaeria destructans TaxID=418781 RepID=A0A9W7W6G2_9PEZI|nr:Eukaryotic rRNA processing protein EBP2 [Teratosphaeria destructans]